MAEIKFYGNVNGIAATDDATLIEHTASSGLGFFGGGFGISVPVGSYQDNTFVTNSNGTTSGIKLNNTAYADTDSAGYPGSGMSHNGGSAIGNSGVPNYYAPLNIRFTHTTGVRVQNCKLRIFDRNDITRQASGVTSKVFECRHPEGSAAHNVHSGTLAHRGVTGYAWTEFDPTEVLADLAFTASPGLSGLNTSSAETLPSGLDDGGINWLTNEGAAHVSTAHDWYVALSASPDSIGSKTDFGLYFTLEYL